MTKKISIAIDGHSSTGKSTVAKQLAKKLNYIYVDTGAMYRAVTYFALQSGCFNDVELNEECLLSKLNSVDIEFRKQANQEQGEVYLNNKNVEEYIRDMQVSSRVSTVAKLPEVRKKLVEIQQKMGENKGIVMDGRDIGTVVFPDAELKIFMTASAKIRAERRYNELKEKEANVSFEEVLANVKERDEIDSNRTHSPLKMADDAIKIDNSNLSPTEQFDQIMKLVEEKIN
ncbi:(d)CMP kinase [Psychroflexus planctonicus]|uniref:Cytidylate kinase n=1 Tax=Psychroflexus planctonicus TaxID=1526575 RepID=A0ABQ1SDM4_9FLAO|nr:(d)CMP kinase [Psychroflexus planctonicus]GGE31290.1 cytidylate kinase [Psychroflexus planctonicus]